MTVKRRRKTQGFAAAAVLWATVVSMFTIISFCNILKPNKVIGVFNRDEYV